MTPVIGVLALQGAYAKHIAVLEGLGCRCVEVRDPGDLDGVDGLVIPGGESTTISKMLVRWNLLDDLKGRIGSGFPVFGTCAGLILLADRLVDWNDLPRPGGLDITVARNAYGRQIDSFEAPLDIRIPGSPEFDDAPFTGVFIRAPRIRPDEIGSGVEVLSRFEGFPVLVRRGSLLGAAFHPELTGDDRLHRLFLNLAAHGVRGVGKQAG